MAGNTEKDSKEKKKENRIFAWFKKLPGRIRGFFKGVKTEYSKIVFPNVETLKKQTTAVIVISLIIGILIFGLDAGMKALLGLIL